MALLSVETGKKKTVRENNILKTEISQKTLTLDIRMVFDSIENGYFILPKYHQFFAWKKEDIEYLILALMKRTSIPPIYLYSKGDNYVILNGQQIIIGIFLYLHSVFYKNKKDRTYLNFKDLAQELKALEKEDIKIKNKIIGKKFNLISKTYEINNENMSFNNLEERTQELLLKKTLNIVLVQCNSEQPRKVYFDIFKLQSNFDKILTDQEIRNGIYINNVLYDEIEKINKNQTWRKLFGKNSSNYRDFEYLLRFLSLSHYTKANNNILEINYEQPFNYINIVDDFSENFEITKEREKIKEKLLKKAKEETDKLFKFFNSISFSSDDKSKKLNILILEAVFVAYCKLKLFKKNIEIDFEILKTDEFKVIFNNSSEKNIEDRLNMVFKKLGDEFIK